MWQLGDSLGQLGVVHHMNMGYVVVETSLEDPFINRFRFCPEDLEVIGRLQDEMQNSKKN